jgi:hypothetical protein
MRPGHRIRVASLPFTPLFLLCIILGGCGKPFNVRTRVQLPANDAQAAAGSVTVKAGAILDENALYDAFDANLIIAGVLPIKVQLTNRGSGAVDLRRLRFDLRFDGGRTLDRLKPGAAYKRLISYYDVSAWNIAAYKESRSDFESYGLNQKSPLTPGESRHGLLFFRLRPESDPSQPMTLKIRGLGGRGPVDIDLSSSK